jgi:hypothetical protein
MRADAIAKWVYLAVALGSLVISILIFGRPVLYGMGIDITMGSMDEIVGLILYGASLALLATAVCRNGRNLIGVSLHNPLVIGATAVLFAYCAAVSTVLISI